MNTPSEFGQSKSRIKNDGEKWVDAHMQFSLGEKKVIEDNEVDINSSWEQVSFDTIRESIAKQMISTEDVPIDEEIKEQQLAQSSEKWNEFYQHYNIKFFKDRNYLGKREFPELADSDSPGVFLEVGSGVGNTVLPLIPRHPNKFFYAFDCSEKAIELLKTDPRYDESKAKAFVCDITREDIPEDTIKSNSVDILTSIFFLSALAYNQMQDVLHKLYRVLKPGGLFLFRDYGLYDLAQMRFYARKTAKVEENLYRRSDGTYAYFFSIEVVEELFKQCGFEVVESKYDTRVLNNRKRKIKMYRVWVQCKFRKPLQNA